ncbi:polysaccharide biosynthesis protein [Candidatus Pseudothioglobus singularis]|nr:polysaccharide biosynthesis protein [Candidatus Pseudothioglobus singularis]
MFFIDSVALVMSILASFSIRLGYLYWPGVDLLWLVLIGPFIAIPIFLRFGLYRVITRYIGFKSLWKILQAITLYSLLWGIIGFMSAIDGLPRSVILINWFLAIIVLTGWRMIGRWLLENLALSNNAEDSSNVVIYGAGSAGRQLSIALAQSIEYNPVAFIDDRSEIHHQSINGLVIYSKDDLEDLIEENSIKEVLLAMPSVTRSRRKEIISFLEPYSVVVRSLPSVTELAQGKVAVNDLLEIDLRDLLGRKPVKPNIQILKKNILKKTVLVTGAGGSIGSELCRQVVLLKPNKLILYDLSEFSLYIIERELLDFGMTGVEIFPVIGSVLDKKRMKYIFEFYEVQTIYHAAAYKHVPLVEINQSQGVLNNAIGTMTAAKAAISANVETFVLISTDKAVRPTNIMGVSKRVAELVVQALDKEHHNICFTMVRFGNVLDSSGSVIPLFKRQIKNGGPVTVTHSNVVRYFMTIPEAVELVIQAGSMAKGGEVFVLDMGEPVRIYDLAVKMIKLSGLQVLDENNPKGDIEIKYTGLRPGEKLYEELLVDGNYTLTENKLIMRAEEEMINWNKLEPAIDQIKEAALNIETGKIYKLLSQLVPQFNPNSNGLYLKDKSDIK